jgi:hypothetical protein
MKPEIVHEEGYDFQKEVDRIKARRLSNSLNALVGFLVGLVVGIVLYHYAILPHTIDRRAEALGLMQYSHTDGGMVGKGEYKWTLRYLKTGSMR